MISHYVLEIFVLEMGYSFLLERKVTFIFPKEPSALNVYFSLLEHLVGAEKNGYRLEIVVKP